MTAVAALVGASFASPILATSDALGGIGDRLSNRSASAESTEELVAGGYAFEMPGSWGQLSAATASAPTKDADPKQALGTVVSAVCPAGSAGASCKEDVQVTFIAYAGGKDGGLPALTEFERQLDVQLAKRFAGFEQQGAEMRPSSDGSRWLRYAFVFERGGKPHSEVLGAYRHVDGRGVVAVATGPSAGLKQHAKGIEAFLASARDVA